MAENSWLCFAKKIICPEIILLRHLPTSFLELIEGIGEKTCLKKIGPVHFYTRSTITPINYLSLFSYRRPYEPSEETPALINRVNIEEIPDENMPTAPPSYEDVIKDNPGILAGGVPTAPPSYTESCSATTTQV